MELLAQKLAEFLDISIESAIEVYPILREQFKIYKLLDGISLMLVVFGILAALSYIPLVMAYADSFDREREQEIIKVAKRVFFPMLGFFALAFLINAFLGYVAPDLMMLKEFLK